MSEPVKYTFNEGDYIDEIKKYIDSTYNAHYSGKYQATDMIIDAGHGMGFCIGSIMKYAKRYGKKNGFDRRDLQKIIHYGIIALYVHDHENHEEVSELEDAFFTKAFRGLAEEELQTIDTPTETMPNFL